MLKDHKDEMIVMLKRKNADLEEQVKQLVKTNSEFKKGDNLAEQKIKALEEMHAQKIKTLLKSIQILKKEVQKEKFEKKDNIRAQKIEALNRDIQYCEMAINALRKLVNSEDKCDQAIKQELDKGPKRIRVASREELKMDINKYKNMTLRLLEILKQNNIKQPAGFKIDQGAGSGLKEEKNPLGGFDINNMSAAQSQMGDDKIGSGDGEGDEGMNNAELIEEKNKLEDQIVRLNLELKEKNEKMLELLDEIEEVKIQVYARDKSIELQQKQIEDLLEELRDSKSIDNDIKILISKKIAIEEENQRLRKELDDKFINSNDNQSRSQELQYRNQVLEDQVEKLTEQLKIVQENNQKEKSKLDVEKAKMGLEINRLKKESEMFKRNTDTLLIQKNDLEHRLSEVDGKVQGTLSKKDEDLDAYRKQLIDFEKQLNQKDEQISELQTKIIALSHELSEKEMEMEFYQHSLDEAKAEIQSLTEQVALGGKNVNLNAGAKGDGNTVDINEYNNLKAKWRQLMRREVELQEEIDNLKQQYETENNAKSIKNILDRSKSRGRQDGNNQPEINNNASKNSGGFNLTNQNRVQQ